MPCNPLHTVIVNEVGGPYNVAAVVYADKMIALLAAAKEDSKLRLAILEAMGADLIEVRNDGMDVAADGSGDTLAYFVAVLPFGTPIPDKALLVRPRGEQADAWRQTMTDFTSRPPTPHELLVEAMAATAWETMTRDEGQWTDAIEDALVVAKRDHLDALCALTTGTAYRIYADDTGSLLQVLYEATTYADAAELARSWARTEGRPMRLMRGGDFVARFTWHPPLDETVNIEVSK